MEAAALTTFLTASALLAVTPGPGVVYIVTRTLAQGRLAGLASVAGVACGNFLNAGGAALGLAALFAVSGAAFAIVKYLGAAWLIWLGLRMLWQGWRGSAQTSSAAPTPIDRLTRRRLCRDGLLVALLNPKTTLFFAAFLPQFMDTGRPTLAQALGLGAVFVAIAACSDVVYVLLASAWGPRLARLGGRASDLGRRASGGVLIALGVVCALTGSRRPA